MNIARHWTRWLRRPGALWAIAALAAAPLAVSSQALPALAQGLAAPVIPQFAPLTSIIGTVSAQAYIEGAGLHMLAEELGSGAMITPSHIGTVRNVRVVTTAAVWPAELAAEQQQFVASLQALEKALVANDQSTAQPAAEAVHDAEHNLAVATFGWLASQQAA